MNHPMNQDCPGHRATPPCRLTGMVSRSGWLEITCQYFPSGGMLDRTGCESGLGNEKTKTCGIASVSLSLSAYMQYARFVDLSR